MQCKNHVLCSNLALFDTDPFTPVVFSSLYGSKTLRDGYLSVIPPGCAWLFHESYPSHGLGVGVADSHGHRKSVLTEGKEPNVREKA